MTHHTITKDIVDKTYNKPHFTKDIVDKTYNKDKTRSLYG
jgi:hypothetical protein